MIAITDGDTYNYSVELIEAQVAASVRRYDYNVEGGVGAGRQRGGYGLVREYEIDSDDALLYGSFGRNARVPGAWTGGGAGSVNGIEVVRGDEPARRLSRTPGHAAASAATGCGSSPAAAAAGAIRSARDPGDVARRYPRRAC